MFVEWKRPAVSSLQPVGRGELKIKAFETFFSRSGSGRAVRWTVVVEGPTVAKRVYDLNESEQEHRSEKGGI